MELASSQSKITAFPGTVTRFEPTIPWLDYAIVLLTLLAPALGGATQLWSQGLIVLGCVTLIVISPPIRTPPWFVIAVFAGLLLLAGVSFLPASWFGTLPWREKLIPAEGLDLPSTLSPQPRVSFEKSLLMLGGMLWLSFLISRRWVVKRRKLLSTYAFGVTLLAALSLIFTVVGWLPPFWQPYRTDFGFFPNRNQTANVMALGGIISLCLTFHHFARRKRDFGFLWATAYLLIGVALVICGSRAGVLLYLVGSLLWVVWTGWGKKELKGASIGASCVLFGLVVFCAIGGKTLERFSRMTEHNDNRLEIQRDALRVLADTSWHGTGLGNFSPIYTQYRKNYIAQNRAVHPESDWLWLGIEMGWLAPLLVFGGLGYWLWKNFPRASDSDFRLRAAVFVCLLAFAVHGFADVSGHRMGSLWPALLLLGLLRSPEMEVGSWKLGEGEPGLLNRVRGPGVKGLYLVTAAVMGIAAVWFLSSLLPLRVPLTSASLKRLRAEIKDAQAFRADAKIIRNATEGLAFAPLEWDLYFSRAWSEARSLDDAMPGIADFRRAIHLEPNVADLPFIEGVAWLERQPRLTLGAWREALRRIGLPGLQGPDEAAKAKNALYARMLTFTPSVESFRDEVRGLALDNRDLMLVYLKFANEKEFAVELQRILAEDPALKALDNDQREILFNLWGTKGSSEELAQKIVDNPDWIQAGWFWMAAGHAKREEYQTACEMAKRYAVAPVFPKVPNDQRPLLELRTSFLLLTNDIAVGYVLYTAEMQAGQTNDALTVLQHVTAKPACPAYLHYLEAQHWMQRERWEEAWQAWVRYAAH